MAQQYARHAGNAIEAIDRGDIEIVRRQIDLAQLAARKRIRAKQLEKQAQAAAQAEPEAALETLPQAQPVQDASVILQFCEHSGIPYNNTGTQFFLLLAAWGIASAVLFNGLQYLPDLPSFVNTRHDIADNGVKADLMRVYNRAAEIARQQGYTIHIRQGVRTKEEQHRYFSKGTSKTMNSRHLTGDALDLAVKYSGKQTDEQDWYWVRRINVAMQQASKETGVPIEWGGNWKSFKDGFHWQLPWSYRSTDKQTGVTTQTDIGDYDTLILSAAREFKIDPLLVKSVIWKESTFNPRAYSGKAFGLMQLTPRTGLHVASQLKMPSPDLYDPATNIRIGTAYLAGLIRQFGKLEHALAAYNAGPTAVRNAGGIPPYSETRDYVAKITSHYNQLIKNRG